MLLIVWHSRTGGSRAMAEAAHAAAGEGVRCLQACAVSQEDFLAAEGYLFVCPENLGAMSGAMKEMFDRCYYPLLGAIEGRPYATMIAAGSDGSGAARQIERIVTGWRLRSIAAPIIVNFSAQTPDAILAEKTLADADRQLCEELAMAFAEGLRLGIY